MQYFMSLLTTGYGFLILRLHSVGNLLLFVIALEIVVGVGLAYLEVPRVLQPLHLLLATIVAGIQFAMWSMFRFERLA